MNREKAVLLHSRYNPRGEAERYIESLSFSEKNRFFILIEPGLCYMVAPLKRKFPGARIIAVHAEAPGGAAPAETPDTEWYPDTGISVQDFLEKEIPDTEAAEIRILEWRPALAVYGKAYLTLVEESAEFIKRADANARTTKAFGRNWFRNFFINLNIIRKVVSLEPVSIPLLVTGAGPSLEDSFPLIRDSRDRLFILAVSSSTAALEAAGILPDMAISTDGGHWAKFHLYESFRARTMYPLAAAMTAALPSQCASTAILPISDGSLWQNLILRELAVPFVVQPQRGTVSAAALDLAFALTNGDIYITGFDLENRDIRSHVRPYCFDRFMEEKADRINCFYSQSFRRSSTLKAGGSYGIYASWFEKQMGSYPRRFHSLGKNNSIFESLKTESFNYTDTISANGIRVNSKIINLEGTGLSRKAVTVLSNHLKEGCHSAKLRKELVSLLFAARKEPSQAELNEALYSLAGGNGRG
jgi:hypothetical protein